MALIVLVKLNNAMLAGPEHVLSPLDHLRWRLGMHEPTISLSAIWVKVTVALHFYDLLY